MSRTSRAKKALAVAASLVLASVSTASAAVPPSWWTRDPVCDQAMANACVTTWQSMGYGNYEHCVAHRQCAECPPLWGYMCGIGPNDATNRDPASKPW